MQIVPIISNPNQTVNVTVNGQNCLLNIYQKRYGLFCDIYLGGKILISGVICQNLNRIVRSAYLGFYGDFCFYDTAGDSDPVYSELGTRYVLIYLDPITDQGYAT